MAFLDTKEDLLKIILTEYGREKLSQGDLKVKYYTFFDDEIDYLVSSGMAVSGAEVPPVYIPVYALSGFNETGAGAYLATQIGSGSRNQTAGTAVAMYKLISLPDLNFRTVYSCGSGSAVPNGFDIQSGRTTRVQSSANMYGGASRTRDNRIFSASDVGKVFFQTATATGLGAGQQFTGSLQGSGNISTAGNFVSGSSASRASIGISLRNSNVITGSADNIVFIGYAKTDRVLTLAEIQQWEGVCSGSFQMEMCPVPGVATTFLYQARDFVNGVLPPRSGGADHCFIATGSLSLIDVSGTVSWGAVNN